MFIGALCEANTVPLVCVPRRDYHNSQPWLDSTDVLSYLFMYLRVYL